MEDLANIPRTRLVLKIPVKLTWNVHQFGARITKSTRLLSVDIFSADNSDMEYDPNKPFLNQGLQLDDVLPEFIRRISSVEDENTRLEALERCEDALLVQYSDGVHQVIFKTPAKLLPHCKWIPKRPNGSSRAASNNERRKAEFVFQGITFNPHIEIPEKRYELLLETGSIILSQERFGQKLSLDYRTLLRFEQGAVLNPRRRLTRAYDPHFHFLAKDESGNNCLTDFETISIPLECPNNDDDDERKHWSNSCFDSCRDLEPTRAKNWPALIFLAEGQKYSGIVEKLDQIKPTSCKEVRAKGCSLKDYRKHKRTTLKIPGVPFDLSPDQVIFQYSFERRGLPLSEKPGSGIAITEGLEYGMAIRFWTNIESARAWVAGGNARKNVNLNDCIAVIQHQPTIDVVKAARRKILELRNQAKARN